MDELSGGKFKETLATIHQRQDASDRWQQDSDPALFMIINRLEVMDSYTRRLDEITKDLKKFEERAGRYDDQIVALDTLN